MVVLSPLFTVLLLPPGVLSPLPNKCRFIVWLVFCVVQNKVVDHNTAGAIVFTKWLYAYKRQDKTRKVVRGVVKDV